MNNRRRQRLLFSTYFITLQFISLFWAVDIGRHSRFSIFFEERVHLELYKAHEDKSECASKEYFRQRASLPPMWPVKVNSGVLQPFCIALITNKRKEVDYIVRSAAYLFNRLESTTNELYSRKKLKVFIANAQRPKSDHNILSIFGSFVDIVHLEDLKEQPIRSSNLPISHAWIRDEILDAALIFDVAQSMDCGYFMVLEDDGIVSRNFYNDVLLALHTLEETTKGQYFTLKLFYSDALSGWSKTLSDIMLLFGLSFVVVLLEVIVLISWKPAFLKHRRFLITVLYLWIFYIMLFLAVGKQTMFPKYHDSGIIKLDRRSFSTVGVVYKQKHLITLSEYLKMKARQMESVPVKEWKKNGLKPLDLLINDFADSVLNLDTYLLLPNVVQHIGRISSIVGKNKKKPGSIVKLIQSNSFPTTDEDF